MYNSICSLNSIGIIVFSQEKIILQKGSIQTILLSTINVWNYVDLIILGFGQEQTKIISNLFDKRTEYN